MQRFTHVRLVVPVCVLLALAACHRPPPGLPKVYTIGGNVTGLSGNLVLQLNGANNLALSASGSFSFPTGLPGSTAYAVTVLTAPTLQSCNVTNGSGTVGSANVTNVAVGCANLPIISGTAAVGTPLTGTLTAKDALGATRTTPIGPNGEYTVDLAGMTGPFMFRAEGTANGRDYVVHSAGTTADFAGTVNVTQLTDLILANVAGQSPAAYFDAGNFAALTQAALDAEAAQLRTRLLPVLQAVGVNPTADLMNTPFIPLTSPLDAALDVLRVSFDATTNVATITNVVTQQQIQDNVTVPAAGEGGAQVMNVTSNLGGAASDMDAVEGLFATLTAQLATSLPPAANLDPLFSLAYIDNDEGRAPVIESLTTDPGAIGLTFTGIDIKRMDYAALPVITATVDFTTIEANGENDRLRNFLVRKETDGVWRFLGDQRVLEVQVSAGMYRTYNVPCTATGLHVGFFDEDPTNNGGLIHHFRLYGPGLPAAGLRYIRTTAGVGGNWVNEATGSPYYQMSGDCQPPVLSDAAIAALPDGATYYFVAFTSTDDSVRLPLPGGHVAPGTPIDGAYSDDVPKRPLTRTEVLASTKFALITTPTSSTFSTYSGGDLAVAVSNIFQPAGLILQYRTRTGGAQDSFSEFAPDAGGTFSTTLTLPPLPPFDAINYRSLRVPFVDDDGRNFMAGYEHFGSTVGGTISGLSGSLTLRLNGANDKTVTANGFYAINAIVPVGASYSVTIASHPENQICAVANPNGVGTGGNIFNANVTCRSYSLGGSISGLSAPGLRLQVAGGNDLFPVGGALSFAFPASVSYRLPGAPNLVSYSVLIATQPAGQTCTILNSTGLIPFATPDVTSVALTCVDNVTDPLSGTYKVTMVDNGSFPYRNFLTFYPDGTYIFGIHEDAVGCAPGESFHVVEYGVYNFNAATGELSIDQALDTGCGGLDDDTPRGQFTELGTVTVGFDGGLFLFASPTENLTLAPVPSIAGTLIGSWGDNQTFDVYGTDGTIFSATVRNLVGFAGSTPGIEDGCYLLAGTTSAGSYTLNFSASCAVSGVQTGADSTGPLGHSVYSTNSITRSFTVTGNTLQHVGGFPLQRIVTD